MCSGVSLLDGDEQPFLHQKPHVPASHFTVQTPFSLDLTSQLRIQPVCASGTVTIGKQLVPDLTDTATQVQDVDLSPSECFAAEGEYPISPSLSDHDWSPAAARDQTSVLVETIRASLTREDLVQLEQTQSTYAQINSPGYQAMNDRSDHPAPLQSFIPLADPLCDIPLPITGLLQTFVTAPSTSTQAGIQLLTTDQYSSSEDPTSCSPVAPPADAHDVDCSILNELISTPFLYVVTQPPNVS